MPIRFYRGSIKRPPLRTLANNVQELTQLSLAFATEPDEYRNLKWRFAIETDFLGEPSAVIFAGLAGEEGAVVYHWKLPFETENIELNMGVIRVDDVVELPAPTVGKLVIKMSDTANNA